jgi:hypothetical protein
VELFLQINFKKISFFKNNQIVVESSKYRSVLNQRITSPSSFSPNLLFDAVLYIANVTKSDYGIYQCKVENSLNSDINEITLSGLSKCLSDWID